MEKLKLKLKYKKHPKFKWMFFYNFKQIINFKDLNVHIFEKSVKYTIIIQREVL